ncbi:PREDICTED: uncharacterized protein LOC108548249 [Eufriesea mexicana]|uniref:uncharacterized protein LOC108548249 n=1 Tax=Eufriesea mexicana TaxID=516756 RepID=UPI00083C7781|nr:PREDICTED: uncharacterized protein LOC108548249 [Eufriesea mexicana]
MMALCHRLPSYFVQVLTETTVPGEHLCQRQNIKWRKSRHDRRHFMGPQRRGGKSSGLSTEVGEQLALCYWYSFQAWNQNLELIFEASLAIKGVTEILQTVVYPNIGIT